MKTLWNASIGMRSFWKMMGIFLAIASSTSLLWASWADVPLLDRVRSANLVITGKIVRIERAEKRKGDETEYSIAWIKCVKVLKNTSKPGSPKAADHRSTQAGDEIPLTMPAKAIDEPDIVYTNGTDGIWILQYHEQRFWATYPKDYQPLSSLEKVKKAIQETARTQDERAEAGRGE